MARNAGSPQKAPQAAQSIGEIALEFAKDINRPDLRFHQFWNYKPIPALMDFFASPRKTKAIIGSPKSTKTWACCFESIMNFTGIIPPSMQGVYPHKIPTNRPRHVRIIVASFTTHWPETIRPILLGDPARGAHGMLPEQWSDWDESSHMFVGPDGSFLSIMSCDPNDTGFPRQVRSAEIDHTQIDDLNTREVWKESLSRGISLPDGPKTVTLNFVPQEGYQCWTYEDIYKSCYNPATGKPLPVEKQNPSIYVVNIGVDDNPSISPEEKENIRNSMQPWELPYRYYGQYSDMAANPYFHRESLEKWAKMPELTEGLPYEVFEQSIDIECGEFKGELRPLKASAVDDPLLHVWRVWELPVEGEKYIISVDISDGMAISDPQAASVWKCTNPKTPVQVAQLRKRGLMPGDFAQQCCCMATIYGECLLIPEAVAQASGTFIDRSRNYCNNYKRLTAMEKERELPTEKIGFSTNRSTKPLILENAYRMVQEMATCNFCPLRSHISLSELLTYERRINKFRDGKTFVEYGAKKGLHDDTVMELAIGWRVIEHEFFKITACKKVRGVKQSISDTLQNLHELEKKREGSISASGRNSFSGMRKVKALHELRAKMYRR
jgi:hypothetical protein